MGGGSNLAVLAWWESAKAGRVVAVLSCGDGVEGLGGKKGGGSKTRSWNYNVWYLRRFEWHPQLDVMLWSSE